MNSFQQAQRIRQLESENQRLKQTLTQHRHSTNQSTHNHMIDFEAKYKKALKQIYDVIQANKLLKEELQKLKTSRNKQDSSISDVRKEEFYKVYDSVLRQKNQLANVNMGLEMDKERLQSQIENLQAQINILRNDKLTIAQQKQALEINSTSNNNRRQGSFLYRGNQYNNSKNHQDFQQLQFKIKQRQAEFHRTLQNYEQHHMTLTKQNKKSQERIQELEQKILVNQKTWRDRLQSKEIQAKQIKSAIRHEYQDQVNNLRKEINSLKHLNTQLMTKIQTMQMQYSHHNQQNEYTEYELDLMSSLKQLRVQMQPMKKQIVELQEMNTFEYEQTQRERTALQMKVYEYEGDVQRYKIVIKNQEERLIKIGQELKKHEDNEYQIKKLEEENRILGGRLIVLESKDVVVSQNRRESSAHNKLQEKVLEFQNRIQLLLNDKQNIANLKNVTIHQLLSLKSYILQMDQKLKSVASENQYAVKKYKSYKQKYLNLTKEIKQYDVTQNSLKSKILGYDKLVQKLQSELEKNVSMNEMEIININSKATSEQSQIQLFKKKYQSIKEKLALQQKYHRQQLETLKLDYETKIVDLTIKNDEISNARMTINMYKQKNNDLMNKLTVRENQLLELRLQMGKQVSLQSDKAFMPGYSKQFLSTLQETIQKQEQTIFKLQSQARQQDDSYRKRIMTLQRQLQDYQTEISKQKLTSSTRHTTQKSLQELSSQNKKLRNQISVLENEIILQKNQYNPSNSMNQQIQFKLSGLEMQKNELSYKLESETASRKRLENQLIEIATKNNELDAEITQLNIQQNRKTQELKYEISQKQMQITTLQEQIRRIKSQQDQHRNTIVRNLDSSSILGASLIKEDSTMFEMKIQRLQKRIKDLEFDNQELRRKANTGISYNVNSSSSYNYQIESLKQEKEQARLKIERLDREITSLKNSLSNLEQESYDKNRQINQLKSELSEEKLKNHDEIFQKDRIISQLRSKLQFNDTSSSTRTTLQMQYDQIISDKQREINNLRGKIISYEATIQELNESLNRYTLELNTIKAQSQSSNNTYIEHMQQSLQEKQRLIAKFRQQTNRLSGELQQKLEEISYKQNQISKLQRELQSYRDYEEQVERLKYSLSDRENLLSKNKFDLMSFQEEIQRLKRQGAFVKEELQRVKYEAIQKDDEISRLQLEINSVKIKITNQIQLEFNQQLYEKDEQISRLNFQIQSLKTNYADLQSEYNETESRERKLQNDLNFIRNDLSRYQDEINQLNEKLYRRDQQYTQANSQLSSLKFLEEQLNEKNILLNKMKNELTEIKINTSHFEQQISYKDNQYNRVLSENQYLKQDLMQKDETINSKDEQIRRLTNEMMSSRVTFQENVFLINQKEVTIGRLNAELNRVRNEFKDLEEEIEQREQEWSNISYELNQAKNQVSLISDQIQSKDINITKLYNESVFLKQQVTRLNEQLVQKNHQINRTNQIVFTQKMQFTQQLTMQKQSLQKDIFNLKRQIEALNHQIEDLEMENRRIKIQNENSRVQFESRTQMYVYTEQDMQSLREDLNKKYREIMQLQLELGQKQSYCQQITGKIKKLQFLLKNIEEQHEDDRIRLERDIESMITKEKRYQQQIEQLSYYNTQGSMSSGSQYQFNQKQDGYEFNSGNKNEEELKFGLHLYTEQTDRLNRIIEELNEEVSGLKLKLTAMTNQEDHIQENLVTMVMTFAEVEALRSRLHQKQGEINEVRKSFIKSIVSSNDQLSNPNQSAKYFKGIIQKSVVSLNNEQPNSTNKISIMNMQKPTNLPNIKIQQNQIQERQDYEEETKRLNHSDIEELNELREVRAQSQNDSIVHSEQQHETGLKGELNVVNSVVESQSSSAQQYNYQLVNSMPQSQAINQPTIQQQHAQRVSISYQQAGSSVLPNNVTQSIPQQQSQSFVRVTSSSASTNMRPMAINVVQPITQQMTTRQQTIIPSGSRQSFTQQAPLTQIIPMQQQQRILVNPQQIQPINRVISSGPQQLRY